MHYQEQYPVGGAAISRPRAALETIRESTAVWRRGGSRWIHNNQSQRYQTNAEDENENVVAEWIAHLINFKHSTGKLGYVISEVFAIIGV